MKSVLRAKKQVFGFHAASAVMVNTHFCELCSLLTVKRTGMTTDVYPRENCL